MPIDPFQQNYDVGNAARERSALFDQLRQKAVEAQTVQNTQMDTNRVDLMKSALANMLNLRETFGSVDTGAMLGQFGIQTPQGLGAPDTYSALRDDTDIQGLKAGVMAKMAEPLKSGFLIGPDGKLTQVATPSERVAGINNAGALERTQLTQAGMDRRNKQGGTGDAKTRYVKVVEDRYVKGKGKVSVERYVPAEEVMGEEGFDPSVESGGIIPEGQAPEDQQNMPPQDGGEQAAIQDFDEMVAMRGFEKLSDGIRQTDGSYLFDIGRGGQTYTYRVSAGAPPQRVR